MMATTHHRAHSLRRASSGSSAGLFGLTLLLSACAIGGAESIQVVDPVMPADTGAGQGADSQSPDAAVIGSSRQDSGSVASDAGPSCGDGTCNHGETCTTCRTDCGACAPPCGDGMCNGADTCSSCPGDCGACPPRCGDATCNGAETCTSCPGDCGACEVRCGDNMCNGADTCASCPGDCGACPPPCGELRAERHLGHGESVVSCDGRFTLAMQADGNLVLYQASAALWSSETSGTGGLYATMQTDGNFVLYDATRALWSSKTQGHPGAWVAVQTDGNVVVYTDTGAAIWSSGTGGR